MSFAEYSNYDGLALGSAFAIFPTFSQGVTTTNCNRAKDNVPGIKIRNVLSPVSSARGR